MVTQKLISNMLAKLNDVKVLNSTEKFNLIKELINVFHEEGYSPNVQKVIFALLEKKEYFVNYIEIINSFLREIGLFPYIEETKITNFKDRIALNAFIAPQINYNKTIFHYPQAKVFYTLMEGKSVILSAPTSFGKSLIIDAIIATKKFKNIVIIVPTIALIDETRKRLSRFNKDYKIITHKSQVKYKTNIYILTQERVVMDNFIDEVDFFIIDEFYKLSPKLTNEFDSRCDILNIAFYKLYKKCKYFYLLGPNIDSIAKGVANSISYVFMKESFPTVGTYIHRDERKPTPKNIFDIYIQSRLQTLVYCNSPYSAMEMANKIIEYKNDIKENRIISALCHWIASTYHPDWSIIACLKHGIGVHHGRLPRALSQFIIELFNKNYLDILVCTSTIIEGVNTSAKNVILYENKVGSNDLDFFTFNNIAGRAGRMFKHFTGNVYIFSDIPKKHGDDIDIPVVSQQDGTSLNILLNLDSDDLNETSKNKLDNFYDENSIISNYTLSRSPYLNPDAQILFAKDLYKNATYWNDYLNWTIRPTYNQLKFICDIMFNYFNAKNLAYRCISSSKQLAYKINMLKKKYSIKEIILKDIKSAKNNNINTNVDNLIMAHLHFIRMWATNHFPRLLMTISYIQEEVFNNLSLPFGNFSHFALEVESLFYDPALISLEEYGIPMEISLKLPSVIFDHGNLDYSLNALRKINLDKLPIDLTERIFLKRAIRYL